MSNVERVRYEKVSERIVRLTLARPEAGNAQDTELLYQLDAGYTRAGNDDDVRVVILAADGDDFSLGHDVPGLFSTDGMNPVTQSGGFDGDGVAGTKSWEEEAFLGLSWRWRNFPKVTIAQVQGRVIAGGLMLIWPCDLVVASDDATFSDPVVGFGINGVELFLHAWEFGPRKAKELLFTGGDLSAEDAERVGMVNRVVSREDLAAETLSLAEIIAIRPMFGLKMAKASVNQSLDAQGQKVAVDSAFAIHGMTHAQAMLTTGQYIDPVGFELAPSFKQTDD